MEHTDEITHGADDENVFRYRLDFYYQQAIIYMLTFIGYVLIRGAIIKASISVILHDPFAYLIGLFSVVSLVVLLLNLIRDRKLMIAGQELIFQHRFHTRIVPVDHIEWISFGREQLVRTHGHHQVVRLKLQGRSGIVRIRIGRYERPAELVARLERFAMSLPKATAAQLRSARKLL